MKVDRIEHPTGESASLWEWRGETGSLWITRGVGGVLYRKRQTAWWFPIWPSWSLGWKERVLNRNRLARIDVHRAWLERISLQVWEWLFQGHHAKWLELHGLTCLSSLHCVVTVFVPILSVTRHLLFLRVVLLFPIDIEIFLRSLLYPIVFSLRVAIISQSLEVPFSPFSHY